MNVLRGSKVSFFRSGVSLFGRVIRGREKNDVPASRYATVPAVLVSDTSLDQARDWVVEVEGWKSGRATVYQMMVSERNALLVLDVDTRG